MAKKMIGIRASKEFRAWIEEIAAQENRTLSNFIKHCILTYLKEKKKIEFREID